MTIPGDIGSRSILRSSRRAICRVFVMASVLSFSIIALAGGVEEQTSLDGVTLTAQSSPQFEIVVAPPGSPSSFEYETPIRFNVGKPPSPTFSNPSFIEWKFSPVYSASRETPNGLEHNLPSLLFARTNSDIVSQLRKQEALMDIDVFFGVHSSDKSFLYDRSSFPLLSAYTGRDWLPHRQFNPSDFLEPNYMINSTWINNLGLQLPRTEQELRDVLLAFHTQDPNKNGTADELVIGFADHSPFQRFRMIYKTWDIPTSNGISLRDGRTYFAPTQPEYREMIEYLSRLYANGLIDPASFNQTFPEFDAKVNDPTGNKYGLILAPPGYDTVGEGTQNRDDFIPFTVDRNSEGHIRLRYHHVDPASFGWFVTRRNNQPDQTAALLQSIYGSDPAALQQRARLPGGSREFEGFWLPTGPGTDPLSQSGIVLDHWRYFPFAAAPGAVSDFPHAEIESVWAANERRWIVGEGQISDEWISYLNQMHKLRVDDLVEESQNVIERDSAANGDSTSDGSGGDDGRSSTFPTFPLWDDALPMPSAEVKVDRIVFDSPRARPLNLDDVSTQIGGILKNRDYPYTYFYIPGGFVVAAGLEAFDCGNGKRVDSIVGAINPVVFPFHAISNGVLTDPVFMDEFSQLVEDFSIEKFTYLLSKYVPRLLKRWRISHDCHRFIVFAVKDDFLTKMNMARGRKLYKSLESIIATGSDDIPESMKHVIYDATYDTTILIYQFNVTEVQANGVPVRGFKFIRPWHSCPPRMHGVTHVVGSGMDSLLTDEQQKEGACTALSSRHRLSHPTPAMM